MARPYLSFTFDDFPESAARIAAPLLEDCGVRGTFYAATGLLNRPHDLWTMATDEDVLALDAAGHEIGWHTHDHLHAWQYDSLRFDKDHSASAASLRRILPHGRFETFAYPYGVGCYWRKRQLARWVRAARSIHPGINSGWLDPYFLRAHDMSADAMTTDRMTALVDQAPRTGGWLVFFTHDVSRQPTRYGTTPALLAAAVRAASRAGLRILPVAEVLDLLDVPQIGSLPAEA